ncbi:Separin, partial [Coniochaeta hoffmannii]
MASLYPDIEAVKNAVSSVSTCSAATIMTLKGLLLPNDETNHASSAPATVRQIKTSRTTKPTTTGTTKAPKKTKASGDGGKEELCPRDRAALATQVVNTALKALGEAAKPVPQTPSKKLEDGAVKEIRILKRRLDGSAAVENTKVAAHDTRTSTATALAELLDFSKAKTTGSSMSLIVTTQIQVLRVLSAMKRPSHITEALPLLRTNHPSSVITFLLSMAKHTGPDRGKLARQMEVVSQVLLALSPSISSSQDEFATNFSLSVSPEAALELQGLGMECRLHWWRLAGHQGDLDKDLLSPLSRCVAACIRRAKGRHSLYRLCVDTVSRVFELVPTLSKPTSTSSKSPRSTIYHMLATLAREYGEPADAVKWASQLRDSADSKTESAAKLCSIAAQLLAFQLKLDPVKYLEEGTLLSEVVTGVQGSLRGDTAELDELLGNVNALRRAAIAILLGHVKDEKGAVVHPPPTTKEPLENFVLQCPRFVLRWLGKPPTPTSSTKDYLRYDQRRQLLLQSIHHTLDSAFVLAKTLIGQQKLGWDVLEAMLTDSLMLLEYMGELPLPEGASSYHVKISHFYYMKYDFFRQDHPGELANPSAALKALRRSIDCVKSRPAKEREKAQLTIKFERMAELCKSMGRNDEALGALQGIRDCLVDDGVLSTVAAALETQHPKTAWSVDNNVEVLCRTLTSIAKLEAVPQNWAADLSEGDQAAALEHYLHFVLLANTDTFKVDMSNPTADALLRIYIPTKHPLRRLRTLLSLLSAAVGDSNKESLCEIRSIATDAVQLGPDDLGEDAPLACYLPHMKALHASITGLADGYPDPQLLEEVLLNWRGMVDSNPTREGLEGCIYGVADLLVHLESVADFLRLHGHLQQLDIVVRLSADISRLVQGPRPEQFVHSQTALAIHLVDAGAADQAAEIFDTAEAFLRDSDNIPGHLTAELQLAYADFLLTSGNAAKANEHLAKASTSFTSNRAVHKISRSRRKLLIGYASYLHAIAALELGTPEHALMHCRDSVRIMFSEWTKMESQLIDSKDKKATGEEESVPTMGASAAGGTELRSPVVNAPDFWVYFRHLFRATLRLSSIHAHIGMYQETVYYAQEAEKMARATGSKFHVAQVTTWMASVYLKAGQPDKATEMIGQASGALQADYKSCSSMSLLCQMASVCRGLQDLEGETEMLEMAEDILSALKPNSLAIKDAPPVLKTADLEKEMAKLIIKEKPAARTTRRAATKPPMKKPAPRAAGTKTKAKALPPASALPIEAPHMSTYRAALLIQKAMSLLGRKDWRAATSIIREAVVLPKHFPGVESKHFVMAACLLGQSLEDMARDSVFSVVHDSTLSFPTLAGAAHDRDRLSLTKHSPPRKGRSAATATKKDAKDPVPAGFLLSLLEAQDILLGAYAEVALTGDGSLLHRISAMLQTVTLVLSTISARSKAVNYIGHAASSADLARNLTWRRERKVLLQEKHAKKADGTEWPSAILPPDDSRRTSLGPVTDLAKFQREYIDIIPKTWTAISISLSENKHDLCITRLQASQTPFVIRLPLERASSRDADTEVLNFQQGRAELLDIIRAANATCHDKRDMSVKGARQGWWANREAIDTRMEELLKNIERDWLGGFRGIFSQHQRRPDLLARFQKSFQNVLDKHLPSRRQVRGKKTRGAPTTAAPKITLDPRILELFIGLGDATRDGCDFDDALTDLLYFVVDILQFHGERNAYDEVDFDAMVVETFDALHAYHAAAKAVDPPTLTGVHTILVLDKALHTFPWESLPCMQGNAASRVPSLACLRRMILEAQPSTSTNIPDPRPGHHIPHSQGTYIIDPSSNLPSTLATFSTPLQTHLPSFTSIISRKPSESEFASALTSSPLLLYFGHGSGAQFIRGRTVRRLEPGCRAVSLLWGCSSASLRDCGEFEVHGTAWNYLMAGCPAVVGTLWDVTDRDIDRFAGRTMEGWGLLPGGAVVVDGGKTSSSAA